MYLGVHNSLSYFFSQKMIADAVDQSKPLGENWHQALLQQMASEALFVENLPETFSASLGGYCVPTSYWESSLLLSVPCSIFCLK
ncbi:hypothetical protein [Thermanaeromonas toyohensis]|uniref:hypothetical protein n=1 Tax=Thermanaeromonas toyohensis TaxID=161154 RepID=UPI0009FC8B4A|nr:hypothetical protein [Thermanaeromonas toyohensis]